jgi:NAD+ kinase
MSPTFKTIGIIGKHRNYDIKNTLTAVVDFLKSHHLTIIVEEESARIVGYDLATLPKQQMGAHCDLIIVVGGDGCFLNAARAVAAHSTPLIGINRGHLGFLTDILPQKMEEQLGAVLAGKYREEKRFLLHCSITDQEKMLADSDAVNEVALLPGDMPRLIEFEIYLDKQFVCNYRADGMLIATPTGSTAYALSGGGPILHPALDVLVLLPMFSHNLSSRPIVVDGNQAIDILINKNNPSAPRISCDGQARVAIPPGGQIRITKQKNPLRILHPEHYSFYETLRSKLGWESKHSVKTD